LKAALTKGPVAVSVQADKQVFRHYTGGIIEFPTCGDKIGHAVLAIGYGNDPKTRDDYVIIKNSWGRTWGEDGFGRISLTSKHGSKGICGVLTEGYYASMVPM
jgi:C1A family cysteine protease